MTVSEHIADILARHTQHVFTVVGGGAMFLNDAIGKHPDIVSVCHHHEQAAAMAATSYSKMGKFGVCLVTTGCGGTNTATAVLAAYQDGVPCVFISGQSNMQMRENGNHWRQEGTQEADIRSIVEPITKHTATITRPELAEYELSKAIAISRQGRPGPVWIEVPLNLQNMPVIDIGEMVLNARRPIVLAGNGCRNATGRLKEFIESADIPLVCSCLGMDLVHTNHPNFIGKIGTKGNRAANFAVQNADLVISVGCRMSVDTIGHRADWFARDAVVVSVDIEPYKKKRVNHHVIMDAHDFLAHSVGRGEIHNGWMKKCQGWKKKWPACTIEDRSDGLVNMYNFVDILSTLSKSSDTIISDAGSAFFVASQAAQLKDGQRYITSGAQAEMGYTLPACIGIAFAGGKPLGITGDGSLQMNIQELQTLKHHNLNIKLFVLNNSGYLSIKKTQQKFCGGRYVGTDSGSGLSFPNLHKICEAYGLEYIRVKTNAGVNTGVQATLNTTGTVICELMCDPEQEVKPCVAAKKTAQGIEPRPLEDMYPYLDRVEFKREMVVKSL